MPRRDEVSTPQRMPVDAREYRESYSLTHFINCYYQVRDTLRFAPRRALLVGVGVGLEPIVLRDRFGVDVTTLDIDPRFGPEVVGSVHDLAFCDGAFDVAICSHVLEHLPFRYFERALEELSRVARHAVIYLPIGGRHLEWRFTYAQRYREYALGLTIPPLTRVSGDRPELQEGQHYWEIGYPGYSLSQITNVIARHFSILDRYHNPDWKYSYNFVLQSIARAAR